MNAVVRLAIYFLETIFVVGILGSAIVVLVTFIEDLEVWGRDSADEEASAARADFSSTHTASDWQ